MTVLVTGVTGYIGGLLAERLREEGVAFRAGVRNPAAAVPGTEAVHLDALDPSTLGEAFKGVDVAYYLIHSMTPGSEDFADRDRQAARNFATAAREAGVRRVIYLGGLGSDEDDALSHHLSSRHETGRILAEHGPPVLEFRAGIVIGAGSASFRMIADLVRHLPAMVTPRWVETRAQPIAVDDVLAYLDAGRTVALEEGDHHTVVEIGGADVLSYRQVMAGFARVRGKRPPLIIPVPVLTPRLSSLWCGLVTSVPTAVARPLIDGLKNEVIVRSDAAERLFPDVHPMGYADAVRRALDGR